MKIVEETIVIVKKKKRWIPDHVLAEWKRKKALEDRRRRMLAKGEWDPFRNCSMAESRLRDKIIAMKK